MSTAQAPRIMTKPQLLEKFISGSDLYIQKSATNCHKRKKKSPLQKQVRKLRSGTMVSLYLSFQVQLLHFLVTISYSNKCTWLRLLFRTTITFHLFFFFLPSAAHKIYTRRRAKKPETMRGKKHNAITFKKTFPFLKHMNTKSC